MKSLIVAGIDTGVGKTLVSAIVAAALKGVYWKPVQCGLPGDTAWMERLGMRFAPSSFVLQAPLSPHLAARQEGLRIEAAGLRLPSCQAPLVIEGTGGVLAPLNERQVWADAALQWEARWILVHRHYLGSLNHFLLTVEALWSRQADLAGVVFNGQGDRDTEEMLLKRAEAPCLGRLAWQKSWTPEQIQTTACQWRPRYLALLGL